MKLLPVHLLVPAALLLAAIPAAQSAAVVRTFRTDFRPSGKALEKAMQGTQGYRPDQGPYLDALRERNALVDGWRKAVNSLRGQGDEAVAKAIAGAWVAVDREIAPVVTERDKAEKRSEKAYARLTKLTANKPVLPGQKVPNNVRAAQNVFVMSCRTSSELQRNITDLQSLHDALREVTESMRDEEGVRWMLESLFGKKKYGLPLKTAAVTAAAGLGPAMLPDLLVALDAAKKEDETAAAVYGIGLFRERARPAGDKLIALLEHEDAGVRELAALSLQHLKLPASIEPLIKLVQNERGQARQRIVAVLEILTGQQHGNNPSAWRLWFAKEGAPYAEGKMPLGKGTVSAHEEFNKKNYYYDIPQIGKGIVYVIDCSGSMIVDKDNPEWGDPSNLRDPKPASNPENSRSAASKRELAAALGRLTSDQRFNIVYYNHAAKRYSKTMVDATPENVAKAQKWVEGLPADSSTNIYDAMQLAFRMAGRGSYDKYYKVEFDTIFLLTDGKPTLQGVGDADPERIIEGVRAWNALNLVVVHTLAMGDQGIDHDFMRKLAEQNRGEYRKIIGDK